MHEDHENSIRKLELGLPYLLKHNQDHAKNMEQWIDRAKEAHRDDIALDLESVLRLSRQITRHFETALSKLKRTG